MNHTQTIPDLKFDVEWCRTGLIWSRIKYVTYMWKYVPNMWQKPRTHHVWQWPSLQARYDVRTNPDPNIISSGLNQSWANPESWFTYVCTHLFTFCFSKTNPESKMPAGMHYILLYISWNPQSKKHTLPLNSNISRTFFTFTSVVFLQ